LIKEDPKSVEIIRPILRGRDIKRYGYDFGDLWLINTHNGIKEKGVKPVNINEYPAIKKHLDKFWDKIEPRADQGDTPYNLRNCAYTDDFNRQKIIYPDIMRMPRQIEELKNYPYFYYDTQSFYIEATNFMMTGTDIDIICCFLASNLGFYVFSKYYTGPQFDETGFRYKKVYLLDLVLPKLNNENIKKMRALIKKLDEHNLLEIASSEIDKLWYEIIGLNDKEIYTIEHYKANLIDKN
jgi:hypothetical protein